MLPRGTLYLDPSRVPSGTHVPSPKPEVSTRHPRSLRGLVPVPYHFSLTSFLLTPPPSPLSTSLPKLSHPQRSRPSRRPRRTSQSPTQVSETPKFFPLGTALSKTQTQDTQILYRKGRSLYKTPGLSGTTGEETLPLSLPSGI